MCGIVGIFSKETIVNKKLLQHSIASLNHRGPDCQKVWLSKNGQVGLGHARLSIIDLVSGDQPIANKTQRLHVVANGEFYGFEAIRAQLEKQGHVFSTKSDTEIVLHLYEDVGVNCLNELRGEFAFIIWDEEAQTCFAARDRFGVKPLFYTVFKNTLYLASEVKALFAAGVPAAWDEETMGLFAASTLTKTTRTFYKNIYQLPPGHYLMATNGKIVIHKYWDLNYPTAETLRKQQYSTEEYVTQLREKLRESIKIRLRADVPIACYLSGGLDSSVVLGYAAKDYHKPLPAYTLSFEDEVYDEYKIAQEMAQKVNASFHPISIKQQDLADNFDEAIWHAETFFYNGHGIAKFLLSKAVRDDGYKVVLTGEGSDELFAGYPHFRLDHLYYGEYKDKPELRKQLLQKLEQNNAISVGIVFPSLDADEKNNMIASVHQTLGFTPSWFMIMLQGGRKIAEVLSSDFRKRTSKIDSYQQILQDFDIENQLRNRDPVNQSLYLWTKFRLCDYILTVLGDRMEMAHSLEGRVPFLDHHIAEFMRDVPVSLKIYEMTEKYLLREAAKPVLTETVYLRQKHPFLAPPALLDVNAPFHDLLQSTLRGASFANVPFFNQKKVIQLLDRLPKMNRQECIAWDPVLMIMLSIGKLQEKFGLRTHRYETSVA